MDFIRSIKEKINFDFFFRKKSYDQEAISQTKLARVLGLFDLTGLGVSCTFGSGIYVLAGDVIANYSGPSIIISFLIAGVCSFLAGLCYAELGSRVPRSGSAYVYIYITIGEFIAFIIGWDVILEYVVGTSSTASALSNYIDTLANNKISEGLRNAMPMNAEFIGKYPDFLAFGLSFVVTMILIIGVKESSRANLFFTSINILVILFIIICGSIRGNFNNWAIHPADNYTWIDYENETITCNSSERCGNGGFFPFGFDGIVKGASKCFYAFVGFDCIATTGEEVINPKRTIPLSIIFTLITVSLGYIGVSSVLTLMIPYFYVDPNSPLSQAFDYVDLHWASYVVTVGAIISLATCLYASMFPMPRVVYSMASDGLIFRKLAYVLPKVKTPVFAILFTGLFSGVTSLIFNLDQLIDMLSIGTLLAYVLVSASCLVLRYKPSDSDYISIEEELSFKKTILEYIFGESNEPLLRRIFLPKSKICNKATSHLTTTLIIFASIDIIFLCLILNLAELTKVYGIILLVIALIVILVLTFMIWLQPQNMNIETFKVPFVPFFPLLSVFVNLYLMTKLNYATWLRFLVWFAIGMVVYFGYGIRKSVENKNKSDFSVRSKIWKLLIKAKNFVLRR